MSNEFGTVGVPRRDRARELEILRQRYRRHRETLASLSADAPTEQLAAEYARLTREIDLALRKLDELEGRTPSDTQPIKTQPGSRPLVTPPGMINPDEGDPATPGSAVPRVALIIGAGVIVLVLIGWLMWRASGEKPAAPVVRTETTAITESVPRPVTPAPKPRPPAIAVDPGVQDYGTIGKGTRAVRQFRVTNNTDQTVPLQVGRSTCRCLYYEHVGAIAPHTKETITVTIDGAKAKRGALHETVHVSSKQDPALSASFDVNAVIK